VKYTEYIRIPPADQSIAEHIRAIRENNSVDPDNDPHNTVQYKRMAPRANKKTSAMSGHKDSGPISLTTGKSFSYVSYKSIYIFLHFNFSGYLWNRVSKIEAAEASTYINGRQKCGSL
jgi:hypothetical protein